MTRKGCYNDYRTHTNPTTLGLILQPNDRTVRDVDREGERQVLAQSDHRARGGDEMLRQPHGECLLACTHLDRGVIRGRESHPQDV